MGKLLDELLGAGASQVILGDEHQFARYVLHIESILKDTTALKERMYQSGTPDCLDIIECFEKAESSLIKFLDKLRK